MVTRATEAANVDTTAARLPVRDRLGVLGAVLVTVVLWASAFVVIRFAGRQFSPGPLALARLVVGSVALGAVMVVKRERPPTGRSLGLALLCGLLWFGVYNVALNAAERRIDAGTSSLLVNTGPIFIALLAGVVLREGFPAALLRGCLVAFAGAALIAVALSRHGLDDVWGAVLCFVAALAYAGGVVAKAGPAWRIGASGHLGGLHRGRCRVPGLRAVADRSARMGVPGRGTAAPGPPRPSAVPRRGGADTSPLTLKDQSARAFAPVRSRFLLGRMQVFPNSSPL